MGYMTGKTRFGNLFGKHFGTDLYSTTSTAEQGRVIHQENGMVAGKKQGNKQKETLGRLAGFENDVFSRQCP